MQNCADVRYEERLPNLPFVEFYKKPLNSTVWSNLVIMNDGDAPSDMGWNSIPPVHVVYLIPLLLWCVAFGTGIGLPQHGVASFFTWKEKFLLLQLPSVLAKSLSN